MAEITVCLADRREWSRFARDNSEALEELYGSILNAYRHATQGGLTLGGGAAPLVHVYFAEE